MRRAHNEGANVFVEIFADRIEVSNPGGLPPGMVPSDLGRKSVRRNPLIADLLQRIDFIEKAGTGIRRMREEAKKHGSLAPTFEATGFFTAIFRPLATPAAEVTPEVTPEVRLLRALKGEMSRQELQATLGLSDAEHFRKVFLVPTLGAGLIEMTIPDKPRSSRQRYRITSQGVEALSARLAR